MFEFSLAGEYIDEDEIPLDREQRECHCSEGVVAVFI